MSPRSLLLLLTAMLTVNPIAAGSMSLISDMWGQLHDFGQRQIVQIQNRFRGGLLWCGVRDAAPFPMALSAVFPSVDACCREHDLCPVLIDRKECKGGVCNPSHILPILHCQCELKFRQCLKNVAKKGQSHLNAFVSYRERLLGDLKHFGYFSALGKILHTERNCLVTEDCSGERCKREHNKNFKLVKLEQALLHSSLSEIVDSILN